MEFLIIAVAFGVTLCMFAFLDEKRKEQRREINGLYAELTDCKARLTELTEQFEITDRQERRVLEGMENILNYDLVVARKAVNRHGEE